MMWKEEFEQNGYSIIENVFSEREILKMIEIIENHTNENHNFRKNTELFAIRCFLKEMPEIKKYVLNENLKDILVSYGLNYKVVKSIYFDKPMKANWLVNWHQDLTISLKNQCQEKDYVNWVSKDDYFLVQPPKSILDNILTIRIHLDDCTKENGALRVIPKSFDKISDIKSLDSSFFENEKICEVKRGGIMLMKPLIWHSSKRTENQAKRRVIHIEFSNYSLSNNLEWAEFDRINY